MLRHVGRVKWPKTYLYAVLSAQSHARTRVSVFSVVGGIFLGRRRRKYECLLLEFQRIVLALVRG